MQQFNDQIIRIKEKLQTAKEKDQDLKVFGAKGHKYILNSPLTTSQVADFETTYNITLPESFKAFLLQLGNGGQSYANSGAGPFYGIYSLGDRIWDLTDDPAKYLSQEVKIYPHISDEEWSLLMKITKEEDISDEAYSEAIGNIYAGILPLGPQGGDDLHGLILNGPHTGKVVYLDKAESKPRFTYENHFLDWYERWLDEVISGALITDKPAWFGYMMTGSVTFMLEKYQSATNSTLRMDCLSGILNKANIDPVLLPIFEKEYQLSATEHKKGWLYILTKHNYELAKPHLIAACDNNLLAVYESVLRYAKDKSMEWPEIIAKYMSSIKDLDTFVTAIYLLEETQTDFGALIIPMTTHENEKICIRAFYTLGTLKNKADYIDTFIKGLDHSSNTVIYKTLLALSGVTDTRLLPAYKKVATRFPVEQDDVLLMLKGRLKEMGMTIRQLRELEL